MAGTPDMVDATRPPEAVEATRQTYAAIAADYAARMPAAEPDWLLEDARHLTRRLGPGATVADIGCGPGHHTALLRREGMRAHGFDLSHEMLTSMDVPGLVQADMRSLPIRDGALDGVWCAAALLHIPRAMVRGVLGEFHRVLRPGGLLTLMIAEGEDEGWEQVRYRSDEQRRYFVHHSLAAITALLEAAGFAVEAHRRREAHRDWLTLHANRYSGVH